MAERIVEFEGRRIAVPLDATDAEVASILGSAGPAAPAPPASPAPPADPLAGVNPTIADLMRGGGTAAPAAPPSNPTLIDTIMGKGSVGRYALDTAGQAARGVRSGLAAVAGLPVDAVNNAPRALNLLPGVDGIGPISRRPVGGSDWLDDTVLGMGGAIPDLAPGSDGVQRGARRLGQELGASVLPTGAAISAGARLGVEGARQLPALLRMFVEPAAVNPTRFATAESTIASGAGLGGAVGNEATRAAGGDPHKGWGPTVDMLSAIFGAGVTGAARAIGGGAKTTFDAVRQNPAFADQTVREAVADRLLEAAGVRAGQGGPADATDLVNAIMNPNRQTPADVIPGYRETVADRTGNSGLAALEYGRQQGPNAGVFLEQRTGNNAAVDSAMTAIAPTETPGAFRSALDAERDVRLGAAAEARVNADDVLAAAMRGVEPSVPDATARGSSARAALQDSYDRAQQGVREAYAPVNDAAVNIDAAPLAERFAAVTGNLPVNDRQRFLPAEAGVPAQFVTPETPPTPSSILGPDGRPVMRPGEPATGEVPLREITAIRSGLTDDVRAANAAPGQAQRARVAGQYLGETDAFLDASMPPELRGQFDAARAARRDVADRFERPGTALQRVLQRREGGGYQLDDSAVAKQFAPTDQGKLTDFRDALREAAGDTRLRDAIADELVVEARRAGVIDRPDALRQFLADRSIAFEQFPELRTRLGAVADAGTAAEAARAGEAAVQRELGTDTQPGRGAVGKYLSHGDAQSERAMSNVLAAKDPAAAADELMAFVGNNPRAIEGAKASFWQKLRTEATSAERDMKGNNIWRGDWLKGFLDDSKTAAVAERIYRDSPQDLDALRAYADVLSNTDLRTRARAPASSGTSQGVSNVLTPETLQSRAYAYMRGQISGTYLATSIMAVVARRAVRKAQTQAIERLTDEVLLDPQKAVVLLQENNPANRAAAAKKAKTWLGNEASTFINLMGEDDTSGDEVVRKVMER